MPNPSGPITSYKQLVEYFRTLCLSHLSVNQFQVGTPSDIDVQTNTATPQRYPFVFMVPQPSIMDKNGKVMFGFSFIVADICKDLENLEVDSQNNTFMIMQDIFSRIIMTPKKEVQFSLETPINIIPFQEKYNNLLVGWTAEINCTISSPFDNCNSAFA